MIRRILSTLALAALTLPAAAQEITWEPAFYDPASLEEDRARRGDWAPSPADLILPLPCGGAMAFQRVVTPASVDDPIDDMPILIGNPDSERGYIDFQRRAHVRGSFFDGDSGEIWYWVGRYEVTQGQYDAVADPENCAAPNRGQTRPKTGVSWFDANAWTAALTGWLRANAADALPDQNGVPGFARLPTEEEWEYAARGGKEAETADFAAPRFGWQGDPKDVAWIAGQASSRGNVRPIGLLRPNALGLHDVIGNVEEVILEPFRMNVVGRPHGQPGGIITRGGSVRTEGAEASVSQRREYAFFSVEGSNAFAGPDLGMRVVLATHVMTSLAQTDRAGAFWEQRAAAGAEVGDDPIAFIDVLIEREVEQTRKAELQALRGQMLADREAREEAADRALAVTLENGALLQRLLEQDSRVLAAFEKNLAAREARLERNRVELSEEELAQRERDLQRLRDRVAQIRARYDEIAATYGTTVVRVAEETERAAREEEAAVLVQSLNDARQARLLPDLDQFMRVVTAYEEDPDLGQDALIDLATEP
ncbi:MAG: SUMF1/EgtB/PvdO family nonheme iron enzyme [Pseudomonadota bacterium]